MRLDARMSDTPYDVWLADECRVPNYCVWADDVTAQWGQWADVLCYEPVVHQARAIRIYLDRRLIIINPIADDVPEQNAVQQWIECCIEHRKAIVCT